MGPAEIRSMPSGEIVQMLSSLRPASDQAVAWLAAVLSSPESVAGVNELARRYEATSETPRATTASGRYVGATTVCIDPVRWANFFFRRRMPLKSVGGCMEPPRCEGWGSVIKKKAKAGFYALDDLATALEMRVDDLIFEVGTDDERARLSACV